VCRGSLAQSSLCLFFADVSHCDTRITTPCLLDNNLKLRLTAEKKIQSEMLHVLALFMHSQIIRRKKLLMNYSCYLELRQGFFKLGTTDILIPIILSFGGGIGTVLCIVGY
jgi:hypothetical protein